MTRFWVVKCDDATIANTVCALLRNCEKGDAGKVEVVEIVPEKRDLSWWERATVNRLVNVMNGDSHDA